MPIIIDGHNLIGQIPAISLSDPDDEAALLGMLSRYLSRVRKQAEVYFDQAALAGGEMAARPFVKAHFVRAPRTADDAIIARLRSLKGEAANWTVVSSDREVQAAARRCGARIIDSRTFGEQMLAARVDDAPEDKPSPTLSEQDLAAWEQMFRDREDKP